MQGFSIEQLKDFLGRNLVDTMLEWTPDNQPLFTRAKISEMILTVQGINILKNKDFRRELMKKFSKDTILSFREYFSGQVKHSDDLNKIIDAVVGVSWRNNHISNHFLNVLDIEEDIFTDDRDQGVAEEIVNAPNRFFELLDYQFVVKQRTLNHLNSGIELNRMLIHMPTGTGKTKTAMHTISNYYNFNLDKIGLVIWMAHTTELLQQAYDTFLSVWQHIGKGSINTYKLWGRYSIQATDEPFNGFMFCGFQKLMSVASNNQELFEKLVQNCRLVVVDEAHKAAASETRSMIERFMIKKANMYNRALIGLTATPGRSTELSFDNDLLTSMFGNKIVSIDTEIMNYINLPKIQALNTIPEIDIIKYFQKKRILARIKKEQLTYAEGLSEHELSKIRTKAFENGYDDFTNQALEVIGRNKSRNMAIMRKLRQLNVDKIPTIVFACSVEHGQLLSSMLSIENIPNALVIGDMPSKARASAIQAFKERDNEINILINYEVLTTGFDSNNIKCVFITRPTQSVVLYSQMLGRGLRGPQMGGNEECLLIDVVDNLNRYNENMAFGHFNNYWKV